jgi:predicted ATP-grasp superfamily ATP-dependent carboligase
LGSMGPESLDARQRTQWERIGEALTARFALRGLFGVDAITTSEQIVPVEVNPRFTASVEVLERAYGWTAWSLHQQACCNGRLPAGTPRTAMLMAAKRIVFAACDLWVNDDFLAWAVAQNRGRAWPALADLPAKPGRLARGVPVLTVLVGPSPFDSWSALWGELDERFAKVCEALSRRAIPEGSPPTLT